MLRMLHAVVVAALLGLVAQPAVADVPDATASAPAQAKGTYDWDRTGADRTPKTWMDEDDMGSMSAPMQVGSGLLMILAIGFGLTLTFRSLRKDIEQRRIVYRLRVGRTSTQPAD